MSPGCVSLNLQIDVTGNLSMWIMECPWDAMHAGYNKDVEGHDAKSMVHVYV